MKFIPYLLFTLLLFCTGFTFGQFAAERLTPGQSKKVHMEAGQVFKYKLQLQKNQFASVKLRQLSVGISYAVYTPGDSLIIWDDLSAMYQTETINIAANSTGDYRIEILWDYGRPQRGEYSISWAILEPLGKTASLRAAQLMKSWYAGNEPGAAVVVLKNDSIIFKNCKGLANLEYQIPITDSSAFELASCSKQFTGFAIAMLIDKGLVALTDDIRKFLPELPDFGKKITIENLIYHTSGIRNWDATSNAMGLQTQDVLNIDMIYKIICSTTELNFVPGEKFAYCNTGYNLLALIVERVTGKKFADWMKENIFVPLNMKNSLIKDDVNKIIPNKVNSYSNSVDVFNVNTDNIAAMGSTSLYSTISDLANWVRNFNSGKLGNRSVLNLLERKSLLNNGDSLTFYSFGNGFGSRKGIRNIEHLGLVSGFRTAIGRYPEQKLAIVFLCNDNSDAAFNHFWTITDLFLQDEKEAKLPPIKLPDLKAALAGTMPYTAEVCPVGTKEYEGIYYAAELNSHYRLLNKNGVLTAVSYRFDNIDLKWQKADFFKSNFTTFERNFQFTRDENKMVNGFLLTGAEKEIVFTKLK